MKKGKGITDTLREMSVLFVAVGQEPDGQYCSDTCRVTQTKSSAAEQDDPLLTPKSATEHEPEPTESTSYPIILPP
jgi:hypothetical protein